jgi:predicted DNA-binding WGR domain protein
MRQLFLFPLELAPTTTPELDNEAYVRLESIDPEANRFRFYTFTWQQTLWGEWTIRCTWGRIGSPGRSRTAYTGLRDELPTALADLVARRLRRGYRLRRGTAYPGWCSGPRPRELTIGCRSSARTRTRCPSLSEFVGDRLPVDSLH